MSTHLKNLQSIIPNISQRRVLDLGAGAGEFVIDATKEGIAVTGLEKKSQNIAHAHELAQKAGVTITMIQGDALATPCKDNEFDFINLCEVIEHVDDPETLLKETYRILAPNGLVYVSVPNRFGMRDQHFKLYFLNWMPRSWGHRYVGLRGKHKSYDGSSGLQRIDQMHYFTYQAIVSLARRCGFEVFDNRDIKIKKKYPNVFIHTPIRMIYFILKNIYFDSFHLTLKKNS